MFAITVYQVENGSRTDLAFYTTAMAAPDMEATVTDLHTQFPAPGFDVVVAKTA